MTSFDLGRILYESRVREAWKFGNGYPERRLEEHPYPAHPADADPHTQTVEVELAQAQAKALLKVCRIDPREG